MILLDTDHVTVLRMPPGSRRELLVARLAGASEEIGVAVVTVEEQMRGWLAAVAKERQVRRQVGPYRELAALFDFFAEFTIAPFSDAAATVFEQLGNIRIGTMDKKIAAIARANNALLLTANRRDFEQIPGLQFANWMDPPVG
ncbi:tRNA(fMet)-specific endonuclease VapC [Gemmata obscuriglobus]|uniref:PIN domain-containing protein n=1 Tax=Gemmata obscuriglobus TaxID=114 RepID=A0A2Z3GPG2_9BACT